MERRDPCAIRRRTALDEDRILNYFGSAEINALSNLIRRAAEHDDDFVKPSGAFGLRYDPAE
jgi:hypothetical protein